jgi:serine/threonine protein phosphatase PrpC
MMNFLEKLFLVRKMENKSELPTSIKSFGGFDEGLSVQGASHIKHSKVCQDFGGHFRGDDFAVAVVCDGHGGDVYIRSDRGSRFGVEVTIDCVKEFMETKKEFLKSLSENEKVYKLAEKAKTQLENFIAHKSYIDSVTDSMKEFLNLADVQKKTSEEKIKQLIKSIITRWSDAVLRDLQQNPFAEEELNGLSDKYRQRYTGNNENDKFSAYGTTLIAVVYTPEFWFGIRIGDGRCVSISDDGSVCDPIPWDEKCFLNRTTSLCDEKAFDNFRHCFFTCNFPAAIYVGTDGIDDSFGSDERLFAFYKRLTETFNQSGFEDGKQELRDYLPKLTAEGSGDDVSISGIVDLERIKELFPEEKEKAAAAEEEEEEEKIPEPEPEPEKTHEMEDIVIVMAGENTDKNDK